MDLHEVDKKELNQLQEKKKLFDKIIQEKLDSQRSEINELQRQSKTVKSLKQQIDSNYRSIAQRRHSAGDQLQNTSSRSDMTGTDSARVNRTVTMVN